MACRSCASSDPSSGNSMSELSEPIDAIEEEALLSTLIQRAMTASHIENGVYAAVQRILWKLFQIWAENPILELVVFAADLTRLSLSRKQICCKII